MPAIRPHRLAVLASGDGSNFEALTLASRRGELGGTIELLACDVPGARVLERAARLGVPAGRPPAGRFRTRLEDEVLWRELLLTHGIEVVLLAGFMRRLHATLLDACPGRILNLPPSLLPAFPGLDAIRRAWGHGVRWTGCTVHVVDAGVDAGPIVAQQAVEIRDDDTLESLASRIHEAGHRLYPQAVRRFLGERWHVEGGRVAFEPAGAEVVRG